MVYQRRIVDGMLDPLIPGLPAILLDGPKGVGKTETALQRTASVFRLDDPARLQILEADPEMALREPGPVLIDEWQRMPAIWDAVKRAVDRDEAGQGPFILTGSPYIPSVRTHSGAGRIHELRMRPMTLPERGVTLPSVSLGLLMDGKATVGGTNSSFGLVDYVEEIVASGFPGIRKLKIVARQAQLDSYLSNIVQKDFREAGHDLRRPEVVMAWLRAYAAATSTTTSWEKIRNAASPGTDSIPAKTTVMPYIEVLRMLRILDEIPAWLPGSNWLSVLGQAPKHHLVDPALAARILGLTTQKLISGEEGSIRLPRNGTFLGALFESLVTLNVRVFAQAMNVKVSHLRTKDTRREVDLIVESEEGKILGIEVKLSPLVTDDDVKHLLWLKANAKTDVIDLIVITTGDTAYRRKDGVAVVPLSLLGP
jgi:predicted AAA+ superfamily ATPase